MKTDIFNQIHALSAQLGKHLAGKPPHIQSAALADCCAMYLAGHRVPGDPQATHELREQMLGILTDLIRKLVEPNANEIDARLQCERIAN